MKTTIQFKGFFGVQFLMVVLFLFFGALGTAQAQTLLATSEITDTHSEITAVERVSCPVFSTGTTMHRGKGQLYITDVFMAWDPPNCDWAQSPGQFHFEKYLRTIVPEALKRNTFDVNQRDGFNTKREAEEARAEYMELYKAYEIHHVSDYPPKGAK